VTHHEGMIRQAYHFHKWVALSHTNARFQRAIPLAVFGAAPLVSRFQRIYSQTGMPDAVFPVGCAE
jgi:hypothetical protein